MKRFARDPGCAPPSGLEVSHVRARFARARFDALSDEKLTEDVAPLAAIVWHQVWRRLLKARIKIKAAATYLPEMRERRDFVFERLFGKDEQLFECLKWCSLVSVALPEHIADHMWRAPYAAADADLEKNRAGVLWHWSDNCRPAEADGTLEEQWNSVKFYQDSRPDEESRQEATEARLELEARAVVAVVKARKKYKNVVIMSKDERENAAREFVLASASPPPTRSGRGRGRCSW